MTSLTLVSITAPAVSAATGGVTVDGVGVPTGDNTVAALAALMLTCFSPSLFKFMTCELRSRKKIKRFFSNENRDFPDNMQYAGKWSDHQKNGFQPFF